MKEILLVSDDHQFTQELSLILTFLGEDFCVVSPSELALHSKKGMASVSLFDCRLLSDILPIIKQTPACAFVTVGSEPDITLPKNVIFNVPFPIIYPSLTQALHRCQEYSRQQPARQAAAPAKTLLFRSLVGQSQAIQIVRKLVEQVAPTDANVIILGESGTGKEVVARNVHFLSARKNGPFIPVNCGAIPGELLESELFGHEKGAFTGAISARKGRFELAEGGTLFLDEIGDMPLQMQVKLLRVLQERTYERVGGIKPIKCNVRIIAATHRNLEAMIEQDKFREDLYYRLNVFPIDSPALRERTDDIPLLLQELISRLQQDEAPLIRFTEQALASLMAHSWPGNVRELSNLVERLTILNPNQIVDVSDLPVKYQHGDFTEYEPDYPEEILERDAINALFSDYDDDDATDDESVELEAETTSDTLSSVLPEDGVNLKEYLADLEISLISQALEQTEWVVARAADKLGMRRTTLVEKMRKYDIQRDDD